MLMGGADDPDFQAINPPNTLREKTAEGPKVDAEALLRAEQAIARLSGDYLELVEHDLDRLQAAFDAFRREPAEWRRNAEAVFQVAHDIKGQGGSFDFPLMTIIGDSLCRLLERISSGGPEVVDVIAVHIEAMRLVISQRMTGNGGPAGTKLLRGLEMVNAKVAGR
jgi:chemotaxis protein histidine kinase CheA